MSTPPDNIVELSGTLTLCEYTNPRNGSYGFWLHDKTRGMNLSIRAKTAEAAFVEALTYYQGRLMEHAILWRHHEKLRASRCWHKLGVIPQAPS